MEEQTFRIENYKTQGGQVLDLELAYSVHGELNRAHDNLVLFPTYYAGRAENNAYLIGEDMALPAGLNVSLYLPGVLYVENWPTRGLAQ